MEDFISQLLKSAGIQPVKQTLDQVMLLIEGAIIRAQMEKSAKPVLSAKSVMKFLLLVRGKGGNCLSFSIAKTQKRHSGCVVVFLYHGALLGRPADWLASGNSCGCKCLSFWWTWWQVFSPHATGRENVTGFWPSFRGPARNVTDKNQSAGRLSSQT